MRYVSGTRAVERQVEPGSTTRAARISARRQGSRPDPPKNRRDTGSAAVGGHTRPDARARERERTSRTTTPAAQAEKSSTCPGSVGRGGARAPCSCLAISSGSVTAETTCMGPPHLRQVEMSIRKTRANNRAQQRRLGERSRSWSWRAGFVMAQSSRLPRGRNKESCFSSWRGFWGSWSENAPPCSTHREFSKVQ